MRRLANRRGTLVVPDVSEWIIQHCAADLTSRSRQQSEARACHAHFSEGPACRVRRITLDHRPRFSGRDKRVPPKDERDMSTDDAG
jgi:hypothetical protein